VCTCIAERTVITGSGKGAHGWFPVSQAVVGFDHPFHAPFGHAVLLDFLNPELGVESRVGVEMNIASAKALIEKLQAAVAAAELTGVAE
jgi:hypothetical protein